MKCKKCEYEHEKEETCIDKSEIDHKNLIFKTREEIQMLQKRIGQFKSCLQYDFSEVLKIDLFKVDIQQVSILGSYLSKENSNEQTEMLEKLFNEQQQLYKKIVNEVITDMDRKIERLSINLAGLKEK